jgi:hypothetical protein
MRRIGQNNVRGYNIVLPEDPVSLKMLASLQRTEEESEGRFDLFRVNLIKNIPHLAVLRNRGHIEKGLEVIGMAFIFQALFETEATRVPGSTSWPGHSSSHHGRYDGSSPGPCRHSDGRILLRVSFLRLVKERSFLMSIAERPYHREREKSSYHMYYELTPSLVFCFKRGLRKIVSRSAAKAHEMGVKKVTGNCCIRNTEGRYGGGAATGIGACSVWLVLAYLLCQSCCSLSGKLCFPSGQGGVPTIDPVCPSENGCGKNEDSPLRALQCQLRRSGCLKLPALQQVGEVIPVAHSVSNVLIPFPAFSFPCTGLAVRVR